MIMPLQYLRGIAAMMVVYHHSGFQLLKNGSSLALPLGGTGAAGVDIFFVISGFIMWVTTRAPGITPGDFLYRRLIRIVPLYWGITLLLLGIAALAPGLLGATRFDPIHALQSLFFIPAPHPALPGEVLPYFIQGWTLNYEMAFYLVFALGLGLARQAMFAWIAGCLGALVLAGLIWTPEQPALKFLTSTLLLEFIGGMAVGWLYLRRPGVPRGAALAALIAGIAGLLLADSIGVGFGPNGALPQRAFLWGLPAMAIVAGAVYLARPGGKEGGGLLSWLGQASYALYLTHILVLAALSVAWRTLGFGFEAAGGIAYVLAALALSSVVAVAAFICAEQPLTAMLRGWRYPGARHPAAAAA